MADLTFPSLLNQAKQLTAVNTAVVHPVTTEAINGMQEATESRLIIPILVGPAIKIKKAAEQANVDISNYEIINTEHSHAAADKAVALARAGKIEMIMKGSLHTDELMLAVLQRDFGLRTANRMSHIFLVETPTYHKLLSITDCALNIWPDLCDKRDIIQNAINFTKAIGINNPKVAILSAIETINEKMKSTIDAAALCKMAERGQITGGILDGPLGFDNAISQKAANIKNIASPVTGDPDILVAPDLEAGNMLAKQLQYLANAKLAGIVLGARIPIILTSRADESVSRVISCALARLYLNYSLEMNTHASIYTDS